MDGGSVKKIMRGHDTKCATKKGEKDGMEKEDEECLYTFCACWGFGGALVATSRARFDELLKNIARGLLPQPSFSSLNNLHGRIVCSLLNALFVGLILPFLIVSQTLFLLSTLQLLTYDTHSQEL